jgi:hypothetical protein
LYIYIGTCSVCGYSHRLRRRLEIVRGLPLQNWLTMTLDLKGEVRCSHNSCKGECARYELELRVAAQCAFQLQDNDSSTSLTHLTRSISPTTPASFPFSLNFTRLELEDHDCMEVCDDCGCLRMVLVTHDHLVDLEGNDEWKGNDELEDSEDSVALWDIGGGRRLGG